MSAIAFNPLVDGFGYEANPAPAQSTADLTGTAPSSSPAGPRAADLQGKPPYTGAHNIPLQVAFIGVVMLAVVVLLHQGGFGFAFAGRLGGR